MGRIRRDRKGVSYYMFSGDDHHIPHIHVYAGNPYSTDRAASISIEGRQVLAGHFPGDRLKEVIAWIKSHEKELLNMWNRRNQPGGIYLIED